MENNKNLIRLFAKPRIAALLSWTERIRRSRQPTPETIYDN